MSESSIDIPDDFICPLTHEIMTDPVITTAGYSYERSAIEKWLERSDCDPSSREVVNVNVLTPNRNLKSQICDFIEKNKGKLARVEDLIDAVEHDDLEEIDRCIQLGVLVNMEHPTRGGALCVAAQGLNVRVMKHLIEVHGAHVRPAKGQNSLTVLHELCTAPCDKSSTNDVHNRDAIIRYVLSRDESLLSDPFPDGTTLVSKCIVQNDIHLLRMLTEFDSDVLNENLPITGYTMMHLAVIHGHVDIVKFLGTFWPNFDAAEWVDSHRSTPLHVLIKNPQKLSTEKQAAVARCLILDLQCDCEFLVDNDNKTAWDLARQDINTAQMIGKLMRKRQKSRAKPEPKDDSIQEEMTQIRNSLTVLQSTMEGLTEKVNNLRDMIDNGVRDTFASTRKLQETENQLSQLKTACDLVASEVNQMKEDRRQRCERKRHRRGNRAPWSSFTFQ
uniref:U-box domain-containing protein n=1 Tax=Percolomonas cosmopolitus TaxID=63605 RepID=A0A7S1KT44_9EUKA|mmetsp:Transcript_7319/g.27383  ORF Transcript_7319/g.27383 Transcript_7319/m.27383 type:complete len:445 (+) Transcript_7319:109-1443(+)